MKKKRLLSLAMAVAMLFGSAAMLPENIFVDTTGISVSAESSSTSGKCGDNAIWEFDSDSGKLTISGTGDMWDYNDSDNRAPWCDERDSITSIEIASGITHIGDWAFFFCINADSITFGENSKLKSIGEQAFQNNLSIKSITIPKGVETIEGSAFSLCSDLESVVFEEDSQLETIGIGAFADCVSLNNIIIPKSVKEISYDAFCCCTGMTDIYMPTDPNKEGFSWEDYCLDDFITDPKKATKCHVPMEYLNAYVAKYATGDEDTDINVTFVGGGKCGDNAWWEFDSESGKLTISGTGDMWDYRFNYTSSAPGTPWYDYKDDIKTVEISEGITTVGTMAFYSLTELTSVSIPSTVKKINGYAFSYCRYLSSLTFATESKLEFIGDHSFLSVNLTDIVLPEGVTTIEYSAFGNSSNIKSVTLPSTISSIDVYAFAHCRNLDNIYMYSDPSKLTWNADEYESGNFKPNKGTKCHVPKEYYATYIQKYAKGEDTDINVTFVADDCKVNVASISNGTVTPDKTSVTSGDTVNLTVKPNTGYKLKSLTVKDSNDKVITVTDNAFVMPVDNVTVTAVFEKKKFTVEFVNEDGTVLQTESLAYGTTPEYKGEIPTKASTAQYTYTFKGWDKDIVAVAEAVTYKAVFTSEVNKYTLTLPKNFSVDGTAASSYDYGTTVKFKTNSDCVAIGDVKNGNTVLTASNGVYSVKIIKNTTITAITGVQIPANEATCTEDGNILYYNGSDGNLYKDTKGTKITLAETVIPASGHSYGEPSWTWTDTTGATAIFTCVKDKTHFETVTAAITSETTNATCTADGKTVYTATVEFGGKTYSDSKTVVKTKLGHKCGDWRVKSVDVSKGTTTLTRICSVCKEAETKTENNIERLAGSGRYETAAKISQASFDQADSVVLAYGLNYADALAGVSLATKINAPILLTNTKTLDGTTLAEIKRLKAKNVIILGGTGAISTAVENSLKKEGLTTDRIFGASRFGTATAIAEKLNENPTDVFFVYAFNSADALSVSPIAACKNAPIIYLSTKGDLHPDTAAYLAKLKEKGSVKNAYVIGGEGVISNDMMNKAGNALGVTPTRVFGKDRFATCVAVNEKFADVLDGDMLCVATGMDFPDALAGGVYAAINKAPLFLINGKLKTPQLTAEQKAYLKTKAAGKITAFGGAGVVPDKHIEDIVKNSI